MWVNSCHKPPSFLGIVSLYHLYIYGDWGIVYYLNWGRPIMSEATPSHHPCRIFPKKTSIVGRQYSSQTKWLRGVFRRHGDEDVVNANEIMSHVLALGLIASVQIMPLTRAPSSMSRKLARSLL